MVVIVKKMADYQKEKTSTYKNFKKVKSLFTN